MLRVTMTTSQFKNRCPSKPFYAPPYFSAGQQISFFVFLITNEIFSKLSRKKKRQIFFFYAFFFKN